MTIAQKELNFDVSLTAVYRRGVFFLTLIGAVKMDLKLAADRIKGQACLCATLKRKGIVDVSVNWKGWHVFDDPLLTLPLSFFFIFVIYQGSKIR